ncbi:MAG: hypothetical protein ACRD0U_00120 [Acidimicrobiales bacterium]
MIGILLLPGGPQLDVSQCEALAETLGQLSVAGEGFVGSAQVALLEEVDRKPPEPLGLQLWLACSRGDGPDLCRDVGSLVEMRWIPEGGMGGGEHRRQRLGGAISSGVVDSLAAQPGPPIACVFAVEELRESGLDLRPHAEVIGVA